MAVVLRSSAANASVLALKAARRLFETTFLALVADIEDLEISKTCLIRVGNMSNFIFATSNMSMSVLYGSKNSDFNFARH